MEMTKLNNFLKNCTLRCDKDDYLISFNGGVFQLNEVSYAIIMAIEEGKGKTTIARELSIKYKVPEQEIKEDINDFYESLAKMGLYMCNS